MSTVCGCWRRECEYNLANQCMAHSVMIGSFGDCLTYTEKDIYKEVEGFSRDGPKEESLCPTYE